jgi:hypothetical protein
MILTAALVAGSLAIAHPSSTQAPPTRPQSEQGQPGGGERPHEIGVGGSLVVSNQGASGGFRYFFSERLGVNVMAGWASAGRYSTGSSSAFVMPSFMYMITPPNNLREVDLRPYVGGGPTWVHSSASAAMRPGMTANATANNWGMQAFGGVEMSFRSAKAMTISAEGIYYNVPSNISTSTNFSGFDWAVAFHFYLK